MAARGEGGGMRGWSSEGTKVREARSNFRVCDVLINYESFGRTFADSSAGDRLRRLRNEFVIAVGPDGERELSVTCALIMPTDRPTTSDSPTRRMSPPQIIWTIQASVKLSR